MNKKIILFDLDGTLTDSGEGIFSCAETVLRHFHLPVPSRKEMRFMVGPPLTESFPKFGIRDEDLPEAIEVYREQYHREGIFQNFPYPGIPSLLKNLKAQGHMLCVATSKPEYMAHMVLDNFGLAEQFDLICGAASDQARNTKSQVIGYLLQSIQQSMEIIMVGDTIYDVLGAAEFQIPTIGVAWGYGIHQEMLEAGAIAIAQDTDDLIRLLNS